MSLRRLDLETGYSSGLFDLLSAFLVPCLGAAKRYDRAVGFFRSGIFAIAAAAFSDFISRGGRIRLVCSPQFKHSDAAALAAVAEIKQRAVSDLRSVFENLSRTPLTLTAAQYFATLVLAEVLDVRIAVRTEGRGLFHDKLGLFTDAAGDVVSFLGTANETPSAWLTAGNHESFEVFKSWALNDKDRVDRHREYFERVWDCSYPGLRVVHMPNALKDVCSDLADPKGVQAAAAALVEQIQALFPNPLPTGSPDRRSGYTLQPHQRQAFDNWWERPFRGIVKHATGAGKTVTGLAIIRRWVESRGPVIIAVPSSLLVNQWLQEIHFHMGDLNPTILRVGAGASREQWEPFVREMTRAEGHGDPRIVLGTLHSLSTRRFLQKVASGLHLLLVADEVHWVGARTFRNLCSVEAGGRLGLSATPERFGDPEGTTLIQEYFGSPLNPEISLSDAVQAGRLVPYEYHVHPVRLTGEEQQAWDDLSRKIALDLARSADPETGAIPDSVKLLLIQRARVLKKAEGKLRLVTQVLSDHVRDDQRWLIYCEDVAQLRSVLDTLRSRGIVPLEYHRSMGGDASSVLEYFAEHPSILVAIKCLDEGVDIPAADAALILASSNNPREFIQRRGRVLRRGEGKFRATIHDAVVLPSEEEGPSDPVPILGRELRRALTFAEDALNRSVVHELRALARQFDLDLSDKSSWGFEPDSEGLGDSDVD